MRSEKVLTAQNLKSSDRIHNSFHFMIHRKGEGALICNSREHRLARVKICLSMALCLIHMIFELSPCVKYIPTISNVERYYFFRCLLCLERPLLVQRSNSTTHVTHACYFLFQTDVLQAPTSQLLSIHGIAIHHHQQPKLQRPNLTKTIKVRKGGRKARLQKWCWRDKKRRVITR